MKKSKRQALEKAGYIFEDAEDFLELTGEERKLVELRVAVSRAARLRREAAGLTQREMARQLKTSQPRVARIESGGAGVSLDLMFRQFFALNGSLGELIERETQTGRVAASARGRTGASRGEN